MGTKARGGITLYNVKNGKDAEYHRLRPQSEKAVVGADNSLYITLSYIIEHVNGAQVTTEAGSAQGYHVTARMNNGVSIAMTNGAVNSGTYKLTDYSKAQNRPDYVIIELRDSADKVVDIRTAQIIMEASSYVDIVADLRTTVSQHGDSISTIKQTANSVSATITSLKTGLESVGMHLDGENSTFDVIADKFKVVTTTGIVPFFTDGGKLNADFINSKEIVADGLKAGEFDAENATINNLTVGGKSVFKGELEGTSGSFTSLDCLDTNKNKIGGIKFGSMGNKSYMAFTGDFGMWGETTGDIRKRFPNFYATNIYCNSQFGHKSRVCAVIRDDEMILYNDGHIDSRGIHITLTFGFKYINGRQTSYYKIPMYSPGFGGENGEVSDIDNDNPNAQKGMQTYLDELPVGVPIDVVIFNCTRECVYDFIGIGYGKQWTVINGNDKVAVTFCRHGGAFRLEGGMNLTCCYVNPSWLSPQTVQNNTPGAGVFIGPASDIDW